MITKKAYAKINLLLNVLHQREDGLHEVDMILTPLTLHDVLTFELLSETTEIILDAPTGIGAIADNLVYRSAKLLQSTFNIKKGAKIKLTKNIPVAAGLAGGSSDAAVTLQALVELWHIETQNEMLEKLAVQLGADVPYCLYHQTMRAQGVGEKLTPLANMPRATVLLLKPTYSISTKKAYSNLHQYPLLQGDMTMMLAAIAAQDYQAICTQTFNSFETATFALHPDLLMHKKAVSQYADAVLLSGSGPTLFAFVQEPQNIAAIMQYAYQHQLNVFETELKI